MSKYTISSRGSGIIWLTNEIRLDSLRQTNLKLPTIFEFDQNTDLFNVKRKSPSSDYTALQQSNYYSCV